MSTALQYTQCQLHCKAHNVNCKQYTQCQLHCNTHNVNCTARHTMSTASNTHNVNCTARHTMSTALQGTQCQLQAIHTMSTALQHCNTHNVNCTARHTMSTALQGKQDCDKFVDNRLLCAKMASRWHSHHRHYTSCYAPTTHTMCWAGLYMYMLVCYAHVFPCIHTE